MKNFKNFSTFYFLLFTSPAKAGQGQSMVEYLLVVFLISLAVFQTVNIFRDAMNVAFVQAIINITQSIK